MASDLKTLEAYNSAVAEGQTAKDDIQDYARSLWVSYRAVFDSVRPY